MSENVTNNISTGVYVIWLRYGLAQQRDVAIPGHCGAIGCAAHQYAVEVHIGWSGFVVKYAIPTLVLVV